MKNLRFVAFAGGLLLVLTGVLGAYLSLGSKRVSTRSAALSPAVGDHASPWGRSWQPGRQYVYALDYAQDIAFLRGDVADGPTPPGIRVLLKGELEVTTSDVSEDEIHTRYALRSSELELVDGGGVADANVRKVLREQVEMPFFVSSNRQGAVQQIHVGVAVHPHLQNVLRTLASKLQIVLPATVSGEWKVEELDTTGASEALYRQGSESSEFKKTRVRYLSLVTAEGLKPPPADTRLTLSGEIAFHLDERLWIQTLDGHERLEVAPAGSPWTVAGDVSVKVRQIATRVASDGIGSFRVSLPQLQSTDLANARFERESQEARLKNILGDTTFAGLLQELHSPVDEASRARRAGRVMQRLAALLVLEPARAGQIPALIRSESDRNVYSPLIGALSFATTPESVRALAEIAGDATLARELRVDAVAGLGSVKKPDAHGLEQLQRLARVDDVEIRSTATLGLGSTSRNLSVTDERLGREVFENLAQATRAASDPLEREIMLRALANTGNRAALPLIEDALRAKESQVRGPPGR